MPLGWINAADYSFNSFLLMERFQIRIMFEHKDAAWKRCMGIALHANPAVRWYFEHLCPECVHTIAEITEIAASASTGDVRRAEVTVLASVEDFVTYTTPEVMATRCNFIYGWDPARLFQMADFTGKTVLDVGSGSGRLAFAAAERAEWVYASEPVTTLREYMRGKIAREGISNVRVLDGMADALPFPDDTFDIVMSGHVVGDDYDGEIAELARVCKHGGWLLNCRGDEAKSHKPSEELIARGWEEMHYVGSFGGDVCRYRWRVVKEGGSHTGL